MYGIKSLIRREFEEICFAISSLEVSLLRSKTSKFSEYGFVASITVLPVNSSDNSCLFLHGNASNITSPNFIASSIVVALTF